MKFDMNAFALLVALAVSLLAILLPLTGGFGDQTSGQTATFVLCAVLFAFALGKRFGEARRG